MFDLCLRWLCACVCVYTYFFLPFCNCICLCLSVYLYVWCRKGCFIIKFVNCDLSFFFFGNFLNVHLFIHFFRYQPTSTGSSTSTDVHDVSMEFRVFMGDPQNKRQEDKSVLVQENRTLRYWFKSQTPSSVDKTKYAYEFFLELVNPDTFPKGQSVDPLRDKTRPFWGTFPRAWEWVSKRTSKRSGARERS